MTLPQMNNWYPPRVSHRVFPGYPVYAFALHRVDQFPQPFDLHLHAVARSKRAHPGRRAGEDQVARFERHYR